MRLAVVLFLMFFTDIKFYLEYKQEKHYMWSKVDKGTQHLVS
jgi:hypothetical protein